MQGWRSGGMERGGRRDGGMERGGMEGWREEEGGMEDTVSPPWAAPLLLPQPGHGWPAPGPRSAVDSALRVGIAGRNCPGSLPTPAEPVKNSDLSFFFFFLPRPLTEFFHCTLFLPQEEAHIYYLSCSRGFVLCQLFMQCQVLRTSAGKHSAARGARRKAGVSPGWCMALTLEICWLFTTGVVLSHGEQPHPLWCCHWAKQELQP